MNLAWHCLSDIVHCMAGTGTHGVTLFLCSCTSVKAILQPVPAVAVGDSHTQVQLVSRGHTAVQRLQIACMLPGALNPLPKMGTGSPQHTPLP